MKKFALLALILLVGWSCQKDQEQLTPVDPVPEAVVDTEEQIPIEKIFYHKATGQYIYQKGDPYSFENMKRMYENMQTKRQKQFGTCAGAVGNIELTPTHYSLKIYPRNESEQWRVERMQDVVVAYLPFDYAPLPEKDAEVMALTRSLVESFEEEVRYTVTYDDLESVEGPQPSVTLQMPVLYVTWPTSKPLPLDLDYEIVDQLLLPTTWDDRIPVPGFEIDSIEQFPVPDPITVRGRILDWDETLQEYAPVPGLKVRAGSGSSQQICYTDVDGVFTLSINYLPFPTVEFYYEFCSDKWKVVRGQNTYPCTSSVKQIGDYWERTTTETVDFYNDFDLPDYEITRAMYYFYNGNHSIRQWTNENGIRIVTNKYSNSSILGSFTYSTDGSPAFITIYHELKIGERMDINLPDFADSDILGTILHETGHFCHYKEAGVSGINNTHLLLTESFASYVGWYLTSKQYRDCFNYALPVTAIRQSRQAWTKDLPSVYSPLFVDLFDSYNQGGATNSAKPNETITSFSHVTIRNIIATCRNWTACRSYLANHVGTYYTQEEFDGYVSNYDYWFTNN